MPFRRQLWPVIVATTALVAGCGISVATTSADSTFGDVPAAGGFAGDAGGGGANGEDGSQQRVDAGGAPPVGANPLCLVSAAAHTCDPQDKNDATDGGSTATAKCAAILDSNGDGGDAGPYACHLAKVDGRVQPTCYPEGQSRDSCVSQASCAAGYECAGDGTGTCRRYCCDHDACDSASFCDVQPIFQASDVKVPVCMPIGKCELLQDSCKDQTCSVVDQTRGVTSCVDIGPRGVGDECETDHCQKNLVCLGTIGARKCFKLCDMSGATAYECPAGQRCQTNTVTFKAPNIGICDQ
jgi:hypothetical protein